MDWRKPKEERAKEIEEAMKSAPIKRPKKRPAKKRRRRKGEMPLKKKGKNGRPSILCDELALKIFMLARKGLTDAEIASVFDVTEATITNWKKSEGFFSSLKTNKELADRIVERSLFEKAVGYEHKATKFFCYEGVVLSKEYIEHHPPDTTAAIFWLKNRQPELWRDRKELNHTGQISFSPEERKKKIEQIKKELSREK